MKTVLIVISTLFFASFYGLAQLPFTYPPVKTVTLKNTNDNIDSKFIKNSISENYIASSKVDIELYYTKKGLKSSHKAFSLKLDGTPIYGARIVTHRYPNRDLIIQLQIPKSVAREQDLDPPAVDEALNYFIELGHEPAEWRVDTVFLWKKMSKALVVDIQSTSKTHYTLIYGHDDKFLDISSSNYTDADTSGVGFVFMPSPTASANTTYGVPFIDNNDATNSSLDQERVMRDLSLTFANGIFELSNDAVTISDFDAPSIAPLTSTNGQFTFNRSEAGFEQVNALFHITTYHNYLRSLGFNLVDYSIPVDCQALNGSDQSIFSSFNNPPTIRFGQGGVDDAEDAEVIVHEYGHAISFSAAPNTNSGSEERRAVDEGLGDYIAASYSKSLGISNYEVIFDWDGHNEFWPGRIGTTDNIYPVDLSNSRYGDASMYSGALIEINELLGQESTDSLVFESLYSLLPGMGIGYAASLIYKTDSLLNNGAYAGVICDVLKRRGLYNSCSETTNPAPEAASVAVLNSSGFATGQSPLIIQANRILESITLTDLQGREVYHSKLNTTSETLNSYGMRAGAYILIIKWNTGNYHMEKLLVF